MCVLIKELSLGCYLSSITTYFCPHFLPFLTNSDHFQADYDHFRPLLLHYPLPNTTSDYVQPLSSIKSARRPWVVVRKVTNRWLEISEVGAEVTKNLLKNCLPLKLESCARPPSFVQHFCTYWCFLWPSRARFGQTGALFLISRSKSHLPAPLCYVVPKMYRQMAWCAEPKVHEHKSQLNQLH